MEGILHWATVLGLAALMANVFLAGLVVFFERRNPASTWAWLLVLFFIPILGFLIYMVFGRNGRREKMFREKAKYDQEVYYKYLFRNVRSVEKIQAQKSIVENHGRLRGAEYLTDLAHLHLNSGNWMTFNNRIRYFRSGKEKFHALVQDIRRARKFIHLEYYIWRGDELGTRLVEELAKKAAEGVEVRLLYDGIGNSRLPKHFFLPGRGYRYLVGGVRDYDAILKIQSQVRKEFPDAFVVAYKGDDQVDVKTARRRSGK